MPPAESEETKEKDLNSSNTPAAFGWDTIRVPTICLAVFYFLDFICIFFLPADNGRWDFSLRYGTADIWVIWLFRLIASAIVCSIAVKKALSKKQAADNEADNEANDDDDDDVDDPKGEKISASVAGNKNQIQASEITPLLGGEESSSAATAAAAAEHTRGGGNNKASSSSRATPTTKSAIVTPPSELEQFRVAQRRAKDVTVLDKLWSMRQARALLLNIAFGIVFTVHVACNIFVSIKALIFKYDEKARNILPSGDNISTTTANFIANLTTTPTTAMLVTTITTIIGAETTTTTTTTSTTTTSMLPNKGGDHLMWEQRFTPPAGWIAVLISLLILWSTLQLFALHYFFSYTQKSLEENDIPAFPLLHPHGLKYEAETVLTKCNVCNMRFRPKDRKFVCTICDSNVCGGCVDSKMSQWVEKLAVKEKDEAEKQKQQHHQQQQHEKGEHGGDPATETPASTTATPDMASTSAVDKKNNNSNDSAPPLVMVGQADRVVLRQVSKMQILKELWSITVGFRHLLIGGALVLVIGTGINIAVPKLQGNVISSIILRDWQSVIHTLLLFSLLSLGRLVLSTSRIYAVMMSSRLAINALRNKVFGSILARDFSFFDSVSSGALQSRLTTDTQNMMSPLQVIVNQVANNVILLFGSTFMSLTISWQLSLFAFSILGPVVYLSGIYSSFAQKVNRRQGDSLADSNNIATEAFSNIRTVQSYGTERYEARRYGKAMEQTLSLARITAYANSGLVFVYNIFDLVCWALTLGCGGYLVINYPEQLDVGELVAFQLYVNQLTSAYRGIADSLNQLTKSAGAAERVLNIMRRDPTDASLREEYEEDDDNGDDDDNNNNKSKSKKNIDSNSGGNNQKKDADDNGNSKKQLLKVPKHVSSCWIKLDRVEFTYPTRPAQKILKGISMDLVRPGEITALVAASGSGKSTIFQLLQKFYKLQGGAIRVGFRPPGRGKAAATATPIVSGTVVRPDGTTSISSAANFSPSAAANAANNTTSNNDAPPPCSSSMQMQRSNTGTMMEDDDFFKEENFEFFDLAELDRRSWLKDIAVVSQQSQLWNSTVLDNIGYGTFFDDDEATAVAAADDATNKNSSSKNNSEIDNNAQRRQRKQEKMERVVEAAKAAQAHDFIMTLPDGYDSVTGERGSTISGGQAQRINIARALLRKPSLLLLDEATASLDNESESKVQEAIEQLLAENRKTRAMSVIIIAHRLSSIKNADRILVMEKGTLVEEGSHDELMQKKGLYSHFVETGFPKPAAEESGGAAAAAGAGSGSGAKKKKSGKGE